MRKSISLLLLLGSWSLAWFSCNKGPLKVETAIVYRSLNQEFVLIRDVQTLMASDDEISNRIDSILKGQINVEFISTGHKNFDLDGDEQADIAFEIIDLNLFNPDGLPESFDTLAARVIPKTLEILDNTTFGYPDALEEERPIDQEGHWTNRTSVLGTFLNAGQFQGQGEKYLGIRLLKEDRFQYGWIKIYCSQSNDTLRILEYAYNEILDSPIKAGQKE
jgi:hypothetical protein